MTVFSKDNGVYIIPTRLETDPRVNVHQWTMDHCDLASTLATRCYPGGLYGAGYALTDAAWNQEHPPQKPVPRPTIPLPDEVAGNASNATVALYQNDLAMHHAFNQAIEDYRQALLLSIGPTIRAELQHPTTGFRAVTVTTIINHVQEHYGTPTAQSLHALHARLDVPFESEATFRAEARQFQVNLAHLSNAGQPISAYQAMTKLEHATAHLPNVTFAIGQYKRTTEQAVRTLAAMIAFVTKHMDNVTVADAGYAGAAATTRNDGPPRVYCYAHGYDKHAGTVCKLMASMPNIFNAAMVNATKPITVGLTSGSRNKE